jgi:hypothetical protein
VAQAIQKGLFRISLRQGVMRLLSRLGLDVLREEWDRLYALRSGLFHGTARLSDDEIGQAARDALTLCGPIVLAMIAKEGARIPSIAALHFTIGKTATAEEDFSGNT